MDISQIIKEDILKITKSELEDIYMDKINLNSIKIKGPYSNKQSIISQLRDNPMAIVNQVIPYIRTRDIEIETSINTDDNYRENQTVNIYNHFSIELFSIITNVSRMEYIFEDSDGEILDDSYLGIDAKIDYYNNYSGEVWVKGKYTRPRFQPELTLLDIDSALNTKAKLYVTGLLREDNVPSWVYYLIEGCVNYNNCNNKMALFNIFAALDNFIEEMNKEVFDYYLLKYKEILELYSSDKEKYLEAKIYLQNKIKKFGKDTRRLIDKLKDIMSEVGIKGDNPKFKKLCNMYKVNFEDIEKYRNMVAHGELQNHNELDFAESLYYVLTVILSILHVYDFEEDEWQNSIQ